MGGSAAHHWLRVLKVVGVIFLASACTKSEQRSAETSKAVNAVTAAPSAFANAKPANTTQPLPPDETVLSRATDASLPPAPLAYFDHGGVYIATYKYLETYRRLVALRGAWGGPFVLANDCLLVEVAKGENILTIFGADQIGWNTQSTTLSINGKPYRVGDRIELGGLYALADRAMVNFPYYRNLIEHCEPYGVWIFGLDLSE